MESDFDLSRILNHVVIGENVTVFVDDEAGSLAFLRNGAIEEVECYGARCDVHHGLDVLAIDIDVVLLFDICRSGGARRLSDFELAGPAERTGQLRPSRMVGRKVEKGSGQKEGQEKQSYKSHFSSLLELRL
jgi:hypothetical protein